jgi:hypothetical protein
MKIAVGCLRHVDTVAASTTFNSCDVTLSTASGAHDAVALTERCDTPRAPLAVCMRSVIGFCARMATESSLLPIGRRVWLEPSRADFGWQLGCCTVARNKRRHDVGACRQTGSIQVPAIRTRSQHVQVGRRTWILTSHGRFTGRPYKLVAFIPSSVDAGPFAGTQNPLDERVANAP